MPVTILIVDDHAGVRNSIRSIMDSRKEWKVCGEACNGVEAVEKATALKPDLVLMDISMPRLGGLRRRELLGGRFPRPKF